MPKKLTSAQSERTMLVANLSGGSDPSKGTTGNPDPIRSTFTYQLFSDIMREGLSLGPGEGALPPTTRLGLLEYAVSPVPASSEGTITLGDMDFTSPAIIRIGSYTLISNDHFAVKDGVAVVGEDITDTVPDGIIVVFRTSSVGVGEGEINYPADIPISPSSVTLRWTSGAVGKTQTDDGSGGFAGDGAPGNSSIDYTTGEIVLDTTGDIPDGATTITIDYTPSEVMTSLADAISALPEFTGSDTDNTVEVVGPPGVLGNDILFSATHYGTVENFTLSPTDGSLENAEPTIGPEEIG